MIQGILKFNWLFLFFFIPLFLFNGCDKEEFYSDDPAYQLLLDDIDQLTAPAYTADLAEFDAEEELDPNMQLLRGRRPCFQFVFPIYVIYPTQIAPIEVNSLQELRDVMKKWKEMYPVVDMKPSLAFPLEVKLRDGTIIKVESAEQLEKIKARCDEQKPDIPKFKLCFDPVFPLKVKLPDGEIIMVKDVKMLHEVMKKWKENHPDSAQLPEILFPIKIKTFKGEIIVIKDMDQLKRYLKDCIRKMQNHRPFNGDGK